MITENGRVRDTVEALAHGDLGQVGALLDASHASLRDDFEISTPAVEATIGRLREAGADRGRGSSAVASVGTCSGCCRPERRRPRAPWWSRPVRART